MSFDYSKLLGRIIEKYGSQQKFAVALGVSERSLSEKLNNKALWKQKDIAKAAELLEICLDKIGVYFFNKKFKRVDLLRD